MYRISTATKLNNSVLNFLVVIDAQRNICEDNTTEDSFSDLVRNNGIFDHIANEVNSANLPAIIDFYFVDDVRNTFTPNNLIDVKKDNIIAKIVLPFAPTNLELERTIKIFYEKYFKNFDLIDYYVKNFSKSQHKIKEQTEDFDYIKYLFIDYLYHPKMDDWEKDVYSALNDVKKELKYINIKSDEICNLLEESLNLCKYAQELVLAFVSKNDPERYIRAKNMIKPSIEPQNILQQRYNYKKSLDVQKSELYQYIKNKISEFYHTANEMLSKHIDTIQGLDIYDQSRNESPYETMLKPKNSPSKINLNIISLVREAVRAYGNIGIPAVINKMGECLHIPDPEQREKFNQQILKSMKEDNLINPDSDDPSGLGS